MLQAMQQQFEHMNVVFNDIQDQMDRQDAVIASLREERTQRAPHARRQGRRVHVDDSDDYHVVPIIWYQSTGSKISFLSLYLLFPFIIISCSFYVLYSSFLFF